MDPWETRKVSSRPSQDEVPGIGVWRQSGAASQELPRSCSRLGSGKGSGRQSGRQSGTASQELLQTATRLPPDRCHGLESATRPDLPGASPCCQEVKQGVEVRWGEVERLGARGEVSS